MNHRTENCTLAYRLLRTHAYLIALGLAQLLLGSSDVSAGPPATVERVLEMTPFRANDWSAIKRGETAAATVAGISNREIAVGVACLVDKRRTDPLGPFRQPKSMLPENIVTASESLPTTLTQDAFNTLTLGESSTQVANYYRQFRGGIGLNLSSKEIVDFQIAANQTNYPADHFHAQLRHQLLDRLQSYRTNGLAGMQAYDRGNSGSTDPAHEFRLTMLDAKPFKEFFPEFYQIWIEDPPMVPGNGREQYFWINADLDGLPAFILSHRIELDLGGRQIIGERFFYSSRFINVGFALAATIPVAEGHLFFYAYRVWIDEWSAFADLKQKAGQKLMINRMKAHLDKIVICGSK